MSGICPFCPPPSDRILFDRPLAIAFLDSYPLTEGHSLVVPRRHVAGLFELPPDEQLAVWQLVAETRALLVERFSTDSFNIGVNDGPSAGQTIAHAHGNTWITGKNVEPIPSNWEQYLDPQQAA